MDSGATIVYRELVDDELGPEFVLDRIMSSETEAVYFGDFAEQTGMKEFDMTLRFTSSSTVEGLMEGCPNRENTGRLLEAVEE